MSTWWDSGWFKMFTLSVLSIFSGFFNNKNFLIISNTVLFNSDDKKIQPTNPQPVQATGWGRGKVKSPVSHAPHSPRTTSLRGCAIHHRALQASLPLGGALLPTSTCRTSSSQCRLQQGPVRVHFLRCSFWSTVCLPHCAASTRVGIQCPRVSSVLRTHGEC